jgi:hypothetical protein
MTSYKPRIRLLVLFYAVLCTLTTVVYSGPVVELGVAGEDTTSGSADESASTSESVAATVQLSGASSSSAATSLVSGSSSQSIVSSADDSTSQSTREATTEASVPTVSSLQQSDIFTSPDIPISNTNPDIQQLLTEDGGQTAGAFHPSSLPVKKISVSDPTLATDPDTGATLTVNGNTSQKCHVHRSKRNTHLLFSL